ncbi:MAG TPA: COQ9 family protein [Acetobacteraceae bacterium]
MITPPERLPERDAAILAMLPSVAFDGWTKRALRAGVAAAGMPADEADLLFPLGTVDMIETYCDLADRRMEEAAAGLTETRLPARVRALIALRLEQNRPYKEAVRRAAAILSLPHNAQAAAACTARTVDAIWHAAGDRSADFTWYTKRAILTAIYTATILYWLRDTSDNNAPTLAFLDRLLATHARLHRLVRRTNTRLSQLPLPRALGIGDTA